MSGWRERLRKAREEAGYSTRKLARAVKEEADLEVSHGSVNQYETGGSRPRVEYLIAFCQITGTNPTWLLTGQPPMRWSEEETRKRRRMVAQYLREIADTIDDGDRDLSDLFPDTPPLRVGEGGDENGGYAEEAG